MRSLVNLGTRRVSFDFLVRSEFFAVLFKFVFKVLAYFLPVSERLRFFNLFFLNTDGV